jgi:tetratricopeptide (TPR) repeat protein
MLVEGCHELVQAILKVSEAYLYEARLDDALCLLDSDVLDLVGTGLTPGDRARVQYQRARIMRYRCWLDNGGYDAVLEILSQVEETAMVLDDKSLLADVLDLTGEVVYAKELWRSTLETPLAYFAQGLALRREIADDKGVATSLLHVGWVYQHKTDADDGDLQRAFEHFCEAYRLAEKDGYPLLRAEAARHMADIYRRRGELDSALSGHLEFVSISEELGYRLFLPAGYVMVGVSYLTKGELDEALAYCEKAHALAQEIGANSSLAEALFGIGAVKEAEQDVDAALSYYREALAVAQSASFQFVVELATRKIESLAGEQAQ